MRCKVCKEEGYIMGDLVCIGFVVNVMFFFGEKNYLLNFFICDIIIFGYNYILVEYVY